MSNVIRGLTIAACLAGTMLGGICAAASSGPTAGLEQAEAFLQQGRYDEALTLLRAEYDQAQQPEVLRLLARTQFLVGDVEQASPLLAQAVQAFPDDWALRRASARTALALGRPQQARPHIDRLLQQSADAQAHLLDGDARAALGDPEGAIAAYERALEQADPTLRQRLALRLVPLYRQLGRPADAREMGEKAVAAAPDSFDAASLQLLLNAEAPDDAGDLSAYLHYRLEYDDNAQLLPDDPGVATGDSEDIRHVLMADVLGRYGLGGGWDLFGEFHLYSGFHQDLDAFDQTLFNFVAGPGWSGDNIGLRLPVEFTRNNLDGERLSDTWSVSPSLWFRWGGGSLLQGFVRYAEDDYADVLRPGEDRDGERLGGGLLLYHPFDADGSHFRVLAEHYTDDTDGDNWDRTLTRFLALGDFRFAGDYSLGASYQYEDYDYDNLHDLFLETRQDRVNSFSAWLAWRFQPSWEARLQATYTDWDSNISAFAYQRTVVGLGVSWQY